MYNYIVKTISVEKAFKSEKRFSRGFSKIERIGVYCATKRNVSEMPTLQILYIICKSNCNNSWPEDGFTSNNLELSRGQIY